MATAPSVGSLPAWSSRPANVVSKPWASPESAIERASSSAVPMLEPNSTVSFVPWLLAAFFGAAFLGAGRAATLTPDPRTTSGRSFTRIIRPSGLMVSDSLILSW